jgi:hypothetical protein
VKQINKFQELGGSLGGGLYLMIDKRTLNRQTFMVVSKLRVCLKKQAHCRKSWNEQDINKVPQTYHQIQEVSDPNSNETLPSW